MFSGLWIKLSGAFIALSTFLLFIVNLLWKSNKRKSDIINTHEKKDEIIDDMKLAETQAEVKENEALKDTSDINWRDSI